MSALLLHPESWFRIVQPESEFDFRLIRLAPAS
jgi:hypothetical protein